MKSSPVTVLVREGTEFDKLPIEVLQLIYKYKIQSEIKEQKLHLGFVKFRKEKEERRRKEKEHEEKILQARKERIERQDKKLLRHYGRPFPVRNNIEQRTREIALNGSCFKIGISKKIIIKL